MAMFPVFIIGFTAGLLFSCALYKYKQSTPSDVKLRTQENIIKQQANDLKMLEDLNDRLYKKIYELEQKIKE